MQNYCSDKCFPETNWTVIEELALLSALEEWYSEYTDKYLFKSNPDKLMIDWTSVSKHIQSKNPLGKPKLFECLLITCTKILFILANFYDYFFLTYIVYVFIFYKVFLLG